MKLIIFDQNESGQPIRTEEVITGDMIDEPSQMFWDVMEDAKGSAFVRNFMRSKRIEEYKDWFGTP